MRGLFPDFCPSELWNSGIYITSLGNYPFKFLQYLYLEDEVVYYPLVFALAVFKACLGPGKTDREEGISCM